jgi:hypothetical protein
LVEITLVFFTCAADCFSETPIYISVSTLWPSPLFPKISATVMEFASLLLGTGDDNGSQGGFSRGGATQEGQKVRQRRTLAGLVRARRTPCPMPWSHSIMSAIHASLPPNRRRDNLQVEEVLEELGAED